MNAGRTQRRTIAIGFLLVLASVRPGWAAATSQSHVPAAWTTDRSVSLPAHALGEMIRGSRRHDGAPRLVVVATRLGTGAPPTHRPSVPEARGEAPLPFERVAHRSREHQNGTIDERDGNRGSNRRTFPSCTTAGTAQCGAVAGHGWASIIGIVAVVVRDSLFHDAHAPPRSSSVTLRS